MGELGQLLNHLRCYYSSLNLRTKNEYSIKFVSRRIPYLSIDAHQYTTNVLFVAIVTVPHIIKSSFLVNNVMTLFQVVASHCKQTTDHCLSQYWVAHTGVPGLHVICFPRVWLSIPCMTPLCLGHWWIRKIQIRASTYHGGGDLVGPIICLKYFIWESTCHSIYSEGCRIWVPLGLWYIYIYIYEWLFRACFNASSTTCTCIQIVCTAFSLSIRSYCCQPCQWYYITGVFFSCAVVISTIWVLLVCQACPLCV